MTCRRTASFGDLDDFGSIDLSSDGYVRSTAEGEFVPVVSVGDHESILVHSDSLGDHPRQGDWTIIFDLGLLVFVESPQTVWSGLTVKRNVRAKVPFVTLIARLQFAGTELLVL